MGKRLKVLMLVENRPVPADPRVWSEAVTLRDSGCEVSIICPKGATQYQESYVCIENIHVYRYYLRADQNTPIDYIAEYFRAMFMTFWLSVKVLIHHGFDVIHAANPPDMFFVIGLFYRLWGKKYIFDQHDLAPEMLQVKFLANKRFLLKVLFFLEFCSYRVAHCVIVTNLSQKRIAIERGRIPSSKVHVVRNGPDLKKLKLTTFEPELKAGKRYLLAYLGEISFQDGVQYVLYALHHLIYKRGCQDILLVLMGDGDYLPTLRSLSHQLNLDSYVHFAGWTSNHDIARYLTAADLGIVPDPRNGLNEFSTMIKTMEYMAMGKAIVAFDLAETKFSAQDAALYAIPNQIEDYADKIQILLEDEEQRLKRGAIGRKRVEEELSWEHSKEHLLLAYKMLFPGFLKTLVSPPNITSRN